MTSAVLGRLNIAAIAALSSATAAGAIPPKYTLAAVVLMAVLQSFLHPIQQSTSDNQAAAIAVDINQQVGKGATKT